MSSSEKMVRVASVAPLDEFELRVGFTDGTERVIDVERFLRGPVFDVIRNDRNVFESVSVDRELGVVVWPNGADIDPDVLYGLREPAWAVDPRKAFLTHMAKKPITARDAMEAALQRMEAGGLITRATPGELTPFEPIRPRGGASVSELVRADRDERGF